MRSHPTRLRRWLRNKDWTIFWLVFGGIVLTGLVVMAFLAKREEVERCLNNGGRMIQIRCRKELCIIAHVSCGDGCSVPIYGHCTTCDDVCWFPNSDGVFKEENRPR